MKRQKSKKRKIKDIIRIIVLLIALCVLIYPSVSSYLDEKNSSKVVSNYDKKSEELSKKEKNKMIRAARAYNRELLGNIELQDPFSSNKKAAESRSKSNPPSYLLVSHPNPTTICLRPGLPLVKLTFWPFDNVIAICISPFLIFIKYNTLLNTIISFLHRIGNNIELYIHFCNVKIFIII